LYALNKSDFKAMIVNS